MAACLQSTQHDDWSDSIAMALSMVMVPIGPKNASTPILYREKLSQGSQVGSSLSLPVTGLPSPLLPSVT